MSIEGDVENPKESPLFSKYPKIASDHHAMEFLTDYLRREVQSFLRLAQPPSASSRFLELGTDSLMAVEFSNRLLPQFGGAFTISATAVFDYPTIGALAEYLASQMPEPGDSESVGSS
jgi:acyl carrier protein